MIAFAIRRLAPCECNGEKRSARILVPGGAAPSRSPNVTRLGGATRGPRASTRKHERLVGERRLRRARRGHGTRQVIVLCTCLSGDRRRRGAAGQASSRPRGQRATDPLVRAAQSSCHPSSSVRATIAPAWSRATTLNGWTLQFVGVLHSRDVTDDPTVVQPSSCRGHQRQRQRREPATCEHSRSPAKPWRDETLHDAARIPWALAHSGLAANRPIVQSRDLERLESARPSSRSRPAPEARALGDRAVVQAQQSSAFSAASDSLVTATTRAVLVPSGHLVSRVAG